jgi:hypothetical protein
MRSVRREPGRAGFAHQHCDRGERAGHEAVARDHARGGEAAHRPARARVEDVPVAHALHDHAALVVAAARDGAPAERKRHDGARGRARVTDPDAPGRAVGVRAHEREVPAEVDEAVARAALAADRGGAVGGVLLHVAAEVELHAGVRQHDARRLPAHLLPADQRQQRVERGLLGQPARAEAPGPAQDARRDVEQAAALDPARVRVVEQARGLLVHIDAIRVARAAVDPRGEAVVAIARELRLEPQHLGTRGVRDLLGAGPGLEAHLAGAAHRAEGEAVHARTAPRG